MIQRKIPNWGTAPKETSIGVRMNKIEISLLNVQISIKYPQYQINVGING